MDKPNRTAEEISSTIKSAKFRELLLPGVALAILIMFIFPDITAGFKAGLAYLLIVYIPFLPLVHEAEWSMMKKFMIANFLGLCAVPILYYLLSVFRIGISTWITAIFLIAAFIIGNRYRIR